MISKVSYGYNLLHYNVNPFLNEQKYETEFSMTMICSRYCSIKMGIKLNKNNPEIKE